VEPVKIRIGCTSADGWRALVVTPFYLGTLPPEPEAMMSIQPLLWTGPRRGYMLFYSFGQHARRVAGHRASSVSVRRPSIEIALRKLFSVVAVPLLVIAGLFAACVLALSHDNDRTGSWHYWLAPWDSLVVAIGLPLIGVYRDLRLARGAQIRAFDYAMVCSALAILLFCLCNMA
jgi:hypothetical protein